MYTYVYIYIYIYIYIYDYVADLAIWCTGTARGSTLELIRMYT